jgi:hypothetical protein
MSHTFIGISRVVGGKPRAVPAEDFHCEQCNPILAAARVINPQLRPVNVNRGRRARLAARIDLIEREVTRERQRRQSEKQAAIFATARGEPSHPVPQSGVALEMAKQLAGQALFDEGASRILENLGLNPGGRNKSWSGPAYTENASAELDTTIPKAAPGGREKSVSPRIRGV